MSARVALDAMLLLSSQSLIFVKKGFNIEGVMSIREFSANLQIVSLRDISVPSGHLPKADRRETNIRNLQNWHKICRFA